MTSLSLSFQCALGGARPTAWWRLLGLILGVGGSAALLISFHDQFWWAPDEGAYAHVAQRILGGEVLNRDVQDMHAGYINFVNAVAFQLFGEDLLSLRYPLVFLGIVQALLIFQVVEARGVLVAAGVALALTSLSFVQFLNPTANWYALFLTITVVWTLARADRGRPLTIVTIGFLLATIFLFRQLTGVIVAIAALAWLLLEASSRHGQSRGFLAPALFALMGVGLVVYLLRKNDALDWILFGICPLAILVRAGVSMRIEDRTVLRLIYLLSLGGAVGLAPILTYHVWHGSLGSWLDDMIGGALALSGMPFTQRPLYAAMIMLSVEQVFAAESVVRILNGLLWIGLLLLPVINGIGVLRRMDGERIAVNLHPLPFVAVFHGLVSTFHQLPIYLMTSSGLSLAALSWMMAAHGPRWRAAALAGAGIVAVIAVHDHAAQPMRTIYDHVAGRRSEQPVDSTLPHVRLKIDVASLHDHSALLALIERTTSPDAAILAVPFDPQIYFLSGRRNPMRFYNSAIGIRDEASLDGALRLLERDRPRLLFDRPDDKYNTALSRRLVDALLPHYEKIDHIDGLDVYRRR